MYYLFKSGGLKTLCIWY